MDKFVITGNNQLKGSVQVSGSKNVALKALVAACLTKEKVTIHNVPLISDVFVMIRIIKDLGGYVHVADHTITVEMKEFKKTIIDLDNAALTRTSSMFIAPLLAREKKAVVPNPGGCRLGARPIDRTINSLKSLGAEINYVSEDGYFHAKAEQLQSTTYTFEKNTHTGTETLILAAVLAQGTTLIQNAAEEPEVDELIELLVRMGAKITRKKGRIIEITGVDQLHSAEFTVGYDRNEIVTFAIAALITKGEVFIYGAKRKDLVEFLDALEKIGAGVTEKEDGILFYYKKEFLPTDIITTPYPGFMTDWQAPWAVLMTQAQGISTIHETVFEDRFGYVEELKKMGAHIEGFNPEVKDKKKLYNFNSSDEKKEYFHAIKIYGPSPLHNAIVTMLDIRAGASVVIAALAASGTSVIHNIHLVDRGYEQFEQRLQAIGAHIERVHEQA